MKHLLKAHMPGTQDGGSGPAIYVSAGEASGDAHAAALCRELLAREPGLDLFGMGGPAMKAAGCRVVQDIDGLSVMGFTEVLARLPHIHGVLRRALAQCAERRPDVAVLVDYPGFHMRLARGLRRAGIPVAIYIAPQVWAWRPGRARSVADLATKLLVIFDFEVPIYRRAGADVEFVGHPLLDEIDPDAAPGAVRRALGIAEDTPLLAVLPGSRRQEIERHLPVFLAAAAQVGAARPGTAVAVGTRDGAPFEGAADALGGVPTARTHDLLRDATVGLFASGTVTLEAAILGCPGVVGYRTGWFNYLVGRRVVRIPRIALANIVLGEEVMPELLQGKLRPAAAAAELLRIMASPERRQAARALLSKVRERLGSPGASGRAAEAVLRML